jgi:hydrogenase expression/formation protein HypD
MLTTEFNYDQFYASDKVKVALKKLQQACVLDKYRIMEFCGGHTHTFFQTGLIDQLPKNIELIHGPGCPVCVLPAKQTTALIRLLENNPDITACVYGDLLSIPTDKGDSLLKSKGRGANIQHVYSPLDALNYAQNNPDKKILFYAIGFETTAPATAMAILQAKKLQLQNFSVYCNHVTTGAALDTILQSKVNLNGIIAPGHVACVIGKSFFDFYAHKYSMPMAVAGFTPLDLVIALTDLVKLVNANHTSVINSYSRTVTNAGNIAAQSAIKMVFEDKELYEWRGLGELPSSALRIQDDFSAFDAEKKFHFEFEQVKDHPHCQCPKVLLGQKNPLDCKLYGKACTPSHPLGSCMVSSEGACAAYYRAGKEANAY